MNQKLIRLSQRYVKGLRKHLKGGLRASSPTALRLGRQAVALGLETLEFARIHERAFAAIKSSAPKSGDLKRAEIFFTEAITPIIETHRAARQSKIALIRLNGELKRRTSELAATNRLLKQGIKRRKGVEATLKKRGIHYASLLQDSVNLQESLRRLTHQVLTAQEQERTKISCELQDEIAQDLLGIHVRLISLRKDAQKNTIGLKNEIASTRRMVVKSAKSVRKVARQFKNA